MKGEQRFAKVVRVKVEGLATRLFMSRSQEELGRLNEQLAGFALTLLAVPPKSVEQLEAGLSRFVGAGTNPEEQKEARQELVEAFAIFLGSLPPDVEKQFMEQRNSHRPFMAELRSLVESARSRELRRRKQ